MSVFKKVSPLGWCIVLILFLIPCYFIFLLLDKDSKRADEQNVAKPSNEVSAYTEDKHETTRELSTYPGLHLYNEHSESEEYTVSITYPLTGIEPIDLPIQSWADEQKELFLDEVKANEGTNTFPSHLNIQVETNKIDHRAYTILLRADHYNGGANGTTYITSFTFDIEQNKQLALNDLFKKTYDQALFEKITTEVQKEVESNASYAEFINIELLDERLQDTDEWKWGITKDAFTLHFDKYVIGPGSLGPITLTIPLERLEFFLKEQWKSTFDLQEDALKEPSIDENKSQPTEESAEQKKSSNLEDYDKFIALTFDDGPQPHVTPRILETLEEYDAVATFFMLGIQAEYYPEIAALVAEQGHEVASHSISHADLTLKQKSEIEKEIVESNQAIEDITGVKPVLFRPPFGAYNDQVLEVVEEQGLTMILWTVDSLDWKNRNANLLYSTIMDDVEVGSNVLMHDIHPSTADALPELLETLTNEGYQFVTVSELLELQEQIGPGPF